MANIEKIAHHASTETVLADNSDASILTATRRRLVQKTDLIVMPGLALAYFTHTLDRANLGNAKTDGIEKDLGLVGNQFNLLLILFYVPYSVMNIPWTIAAKRFNPAVVMPIIIALWGICTLGAATTKNFSQILACRILMGTVEAAFLPCAVYYCSLFYTRRELALRTSIFFQMGFIAGAVSGLISWSVFRWNGSLKGWQYLFIIEGALTIGISILLLFALPRSVRKCRWFSEEEKKIAVARLEEDSHDEDKIFRWSDVKEQLQHGPTWAFAFLALMHGVGLASSSNFLPTLIKRLTVDSTTANLYTIGPNLTASVVLLTTTYFSDRFQQRAYAACGTLFVSLVAWVLLGCLDLVNSVKVGYFLTYLITFGTFTPGLLVPVWLSSNMPTTTGRAVALGLSYMAQNLAGVVSSLVFRNQDAPVYKPALITVACCQGVFIVACLALRRYYSQLNQKIGLGGASFADRTDKRPTYRYAV
ncbi:MFS general substrate transporter [Hypoxylon trugodes]|uniref:MFS general substrate transporter n=1 Tax=Hypoxylon trugodes TaxID=326681 RepID=UPI00218DA5A5|nr:MFS general substrate transporter [Hypoxylon trugodes]KAI1382925.1 MFS general substrate transporter [Hypoxylon trugodes]